MDEQYKTIGKAQIAEAWQTCLKYKQHKANLEQRVIEDEQWYKLRQWECMRKKKTQEIEPASAWLLNAIDNKHADAMDNFPCASVRPQEINDEQEAKNLSSIIPVILDITDFEAVYDEHSYNKLISGTGIYGVFWDPKQHGGMGDVRIEEIDVLNLFWQSGIDDIQDSRNVFYVSLRDNDLIEADYPQTVGKLSQPVMEVAQYVYDDTIDTTDKSVIVDWYYKKSVGGKIVLHYCKFVAGQDEPLFATENDEEYRERGWYDHGLYPFVFDTLRRCKGTPCGFGYVDIGKNTQEYIDRGDQAIMQNMLFNCKPRHFIRNDGSVNEEEYADTTRDFVHVDGSLGDDSIMPVRVNTLNEIYVSVCLNKVNELKDVTGNRDVSTGGTTGGATAASAIAAMQEAGSKLSRDCNKGSYRAFRKVVLMVIELIRQFYDVPRTFRIVGQDGNDEFVNYSNINIAPQANYDPVNGVPTAMGMDMGYRLPQFDVKVTAEKQSPYSKMSQNELSLQLYGAGFFAPQQAEPALACLHMMDFDDKDKVVRVIRENSLFLQQYQMLFDNAMMMAQQLDKEHGTKMEAQLMQMIGMQQQRAAPVSGQMPKMPQNDLTGGESGVTQKARAQTAEATTPR